MPSSVPREEEDRLPGEYFRLTSIVDTVISSFELVARDIVTRLLIGSYLHCSAVVVIGIGLQKN